MEKIRRSRVWVTICRQPTGPIFEYLRQTIYDLAMAGWLSPPPLNFFFEYWPAISCRTFCGGGNRFCARVWNTGFDRFISADLSIVAYDDRRRRIPDAAAAVRYSLAPRPAIKRIDSRLHHPETIKPGLGV